MLAVGIGAGIATGLGGSWINAPAVGWIAAAVLYVTWVWAVVHRLDPAATRAHATREDPGRAVFDVLTILATVASFGGVALVLVGAGSVPGLQRAAVLALAVASVVSSWVLVHALFMLRYAALYFREGGGISFGGTTEPPGYGDFAYVAFTVGMTFQVSDTALTSRTIRAMALRHALLSYLFGAVVLAVIINLVGGLAAG